MIELQDRTGFPIPLKLDRGYTILNDETTLLPETAEHALLLTDLSGMILEWNAGAECLFGYARSEAVGQSVAMVLPDDAVHLSPVSANRSHSFTAPARTKDGRAISVRLTVSPIRDASGAPVAAILAAHDQAAILQLEEKLRQAEKLAVLGQRAGSTAHDFNNLLTVMMSCCEMLMRQLGSDDAKRQVLAEIHHAGTRAETLARQLLAVGRTEAPEMKMVDLNALVRDTEITLRRSFRETIELRTNLTAPAALIKGDPAQLEQLLLNLAFNARDAMPDGGRLTIATDMFTNDDAIAFPFSPRGVGDHVVLTVADTGVGMNSHTAARAFQPFFTTKGARRGSGLGLASVKATVEQCGGHIEVDSTPGRGSSFRIFFPAALEPMAPRVQPGGVDGPMPRGRETILLAEDDDIVRMLVREVLNECGYRVLEAKDGADAIRSFERQAGVIDLLIADVVMPHLDGPLVATRLLQQKPRLKVLHVSGYSNDYIARYGLRDSDANFLLKPFGMRTLAQKVRFILDEVA